MTDGIVYISPTAFADHTNPLTNIVRSRLPNIHLTGEMYYFLAMRGGDIIQIDKRYGADNCLDGHAMMLAVCDECAIFDRKGIRHKIKLIAISSHDNSVILASSEGGGSSESFYEIDKSGLISPARTDTGLYKAITGSQS